MKYKYLIALGLGVGLSSLAQAQDAKQKEGEAADAVKADAVGDEITQIIKQSDAEQADFMKRVRAETDRAKAMELYQKERPDMKPALAKVLTLAQQNPSSEGAAKGLIWAYVSYSAEDRKVALDILLKHHKDSDVMSGLIASVARTRNADLSVLSDLMKTSKNEKVRQSAAVTLAGIYAREPDKEKESLALYKQLEAWPNIAETNPRLLKHVESQIFAKENLAVGKVAPDIVGTDEEDKEFKLSDYRGKVVMIDFWGIW